LRRPVFSTPGFYSGAFVRPNLFMVWLLLAFVFYANLGLRWPTVFSFISFAFRDQGSFCWMETLVASNLRPGVDVAYSYGLLPLLLQHLLSRIAGQGYWVSIGIGVAYLAGMALFWALFWHKLGRAPEILAALVLLSPFAVMFLPVPPYALVQLGMMFSLLFLLEGRLASALTASIVAWLAVPSLPIVLTVVVSAWIVGNWGGVHARNSALVKRLSAGAAAALGLGVVLAAVYGWEPLFATLLPTNGAALYKELDYGVLGQGWNYLHPTGVRLGYYLGSGIGWWLFATLLLTVLALRVGVGGMLGRKVSRLDAFVLSCWVLQAVFIALAFGDGNQTVYYYPVLICGVVAGVQALRLRLVRILVLAGLVGPGLLATSVQMRVWVDAWRRCHRSAATAYLYAPDTLRAEWEPIVEKAKASRVLVLSSGNGVHEMFPKIEAPYSWFLLPFLKDGERRALLEQIGTADLVVEPLAGITVFIDQDPDVQAALKRFSTRRSSRWFRIFEDPCSGSGIGASADKATQQDPVVSTLTPVRPPSK
jgi:hypothetical protein